MVLETIEPLVPHLQCVWIDEEQLQRVCERLDVDALALPTWDEPVFLDWPLDGPETRVAEQIFTFCAVNFSYWGAPKWTINWHGQDLDGAWGMLACLARAVEEGVPIFDPAYLAGLPADALRHVLRGNVEIPLFDERLSILHEIGRVTAARFDGQLTNVVWAADGDAPGLVRLLVREFPSFDDTARLDGHELRFYKRAQLLVAMLYERFAGAGLGALQRVDELTVFADYKLPQILRHLGILRYTPALAAHVDAQRELPAGSREEIEIRAATVWACELMRRTLSARQPDLLVLHIDYWLWAESQHHRAGVAPYHRTRTTAY